jgi:hypothetical protein
VLKRFLEYAAEFERAYASRDFASLEPFFSEAVRYEIHAPGEPVRRHEGRGAVLRYLAFVTEQFDRRFAERRLLHVDGPHVRESEREVETHGTALYRLASGECCHLPMTETAHFSGEVIDRLVDRLSPGAWYEMRSFVLRHPELFSPALLEPTGQPVR